MGSKHIFIVFLGIILFSGFVSAVEFEWALGDSRTFQPNGDTLYWTSNKISAYYGGDNYRGSGTYAHDFTGDDRMIVARIRFSGAQRSAGCGAWLQGHTWYTTQDNRQAVKTHYSFFQDSLFNYYKIANHVTYECGQKICYCYDFFGACMWYCWMNCGLSTDYVQVSKSGTGTVFPDSGHNGILNVGSIRDLMGNATFPPVNETVYLGIDEDDVLYWLGSTPTEPYNGIKEIKITSDSTNAYVLVCADTDPANGVCDREDAKVAECMLAGGDYYQGICCVSNPTKYKTDHPGSDAEGCKYRTDLGEGAICGQSSDGKWRWAKMSDKGAVTDLLKCPGYSFVAAPSDDVYKEKAYFGCKGTTSAGLADEHHATYTRKITNPTDSSYRIIVYRNFPASNVVNIPGVLSPHGYVCSPNGEIFECKGEGFAYTRFPQSVAETGMTTDEILGMCPGITNYWTFDDATATDTIGNYDGSIVGASPVAGKVSGGLIFSSGNHVAVPNLSISGDKFSIEAWVYPDTYTGGKRYIVNQGTVQIYIESDAKVKAHLETEEGMTVDFGGQQIAGSDWYHIVLTYDGEQAILFVHGIGVSSDDPEGEVSPPTQAFRIGGNFIGTIDDVALYSRKLRSSVINKHLTGITNYCAGTVSTQDNYYCAEDGEWTTNLDNKYVTSCEKSGYHWTGNYCCSEDDDDQEFYNDFDRSPANLKPKSEGGQTVSASSGVNTFQNRAELFSEGQSITIEGPATISLIHYAAPDLDTSAWVFPPPCGQRGNIETINIPPGKNETITVEFNYDATPNCLYHRIVISSKVMPASGGCWNKTFIPRGTLINNKILNYKGTFYGCDIRDTPANSLIRGLQDYHKNQPLIQLYGADCSNLLRDATEPGSHAVCGPGGVWLFTNDTQATFAKNISWNPAQYNQTVLSTAGCCRDDQCWDGFSCVDKGSYYTVDSDAFVCRD